MSIVCQKCRRLVRENTIYISERNYYCSRCQKTYVLPDSYLKRDDLKIPVLSKNTSLKVQKSENGMLIEFPLHLFTLAFRISITLLIITSLFFINNIIEIDKFEFPPLFLFSLLLFLVSLVYSNFKRFIIVRDDTILFQKKLFFVKIERKQKVKNIEKIKEIIMDKGNYIKSRTYVEISFKGIDYWDVGHNLDEEDTEYLLSEMKLVHAYGQAMV